MLRERARLNGYVPALSEIIKRFVVSERDLSRSSFEKIKYKKGERDESNFKGTRF